MPFVHSCFLCGMFITRRASSPARLSSSSWVKSSSAMRISLARDGDRREPCDSRRSFRYPVVVETHRGAKLAMSIEHELLKFANEIAERLEASAARLDREVAELEAQATQIKAKGDLARGSAKRLANFEVTFRSYYQCPSCWIERGERSPLNPISGTDLEDRFRCVGCHMDFSISART